MWCVVIAGVYKSVGMKLWMVVVFLLFVWYFFYNFVYVVDLGELVFIYLEVELIKLIEENKYFECVKVDNC